MPNLRFRYFSPQSQSFHSESQITPNQRYECRLGIPRITRIFADFCFLFSGAFHRIGISAQQAHPIKPAVGLFSFIDIHFIKLTVSKGFDAYSFILSAIRVMP